MNMQIHGEHLTVTDAMKQFVLNQLSRLDKFSSISEAASSCRVNMSVLHKRHTAEITVYSSGKAFHAEETDHDMYQAIQMAVGKLERQISDYKNRMLKTHRHPKDDVAKSGVNDPADEEESEQIEEERP